jgi:hypothetical protein
MFARAALFAHIQQTLFNVETIEPRVASSGGPMMKQIVLLLVTAASLSFATNPSHAQSLMSPCMRVCEPPAKLNTQNCSCEGSTRTQTKPCAVVCPNPDQKLDLRRCRCMRK